MPQDTCQAYRQIADTRIIKHKPRITFPGQVCKVLEISAPKGTGTEEDNLFIAFRLIESLYSYGPSNPVEEALKNGITYIKAGQSGKKGFTLKIQKTNITQHSTSTRSNVDFHKRQNPNKEDNDYFSSTRT